MLDDWRPTASLQNLQLRAKILRRIRQFFEKREVLEVETPLLSQSSVTDPFLISFETELIFPSLKKEKLFLQTSPEYSMKRLIAAGAGSIFQICKAFRNAEISAKHNPEFTILEWYRVGMGYHELMDEVEMFLIEVFNTLPAKRLSYGELFDLNFGINPHICTIEQLRSIVSQHNIMINNVDEFQDRDIWLDLILTHLIEPQLGQDAPLFLYDYPHSQAALAKIRQEENFRVGERFEVYFKGVELANGYHELADLSEQKNRFEQDNVKRVQLRKPEIPIDFRLLEALPSLPDCAGIAFGVDRLVALALEANQLSDVIAFPIERA